VLITYNHFDFIKRSLESICSQKTSFSFNCIIADDCSSDGSVNIISEYIAKFPKIFSHIKREYNLGKFTGGNGRYNGLHAYSLANSKYIAVLDGDDYWTDPHKLQKQVDYLEANPECSICTHWVKTKDESGRGFGEYDLTIDGLKENIFWKDLFNLNLHPRPLLGAAYHPSSWVYRQSLVKKIPSWNLKIAGGDDVLFTTFLRHGYCHRISEYMSTYRINSTSSWSPLSVHQKGIKNLQFLLNVQKHYEEYYQPIKNCLTWLLKKYQDWPFSNSELLQLWKHAFTIGRKDLAIAKQLLIFVLRVWLFHFFQKSKSSVKVFLGKLKHS